MDLAVTDTIQVDAPLARVWDVLIDERKLLSHHDIELKSTSGTPGEVGWTATSELHVGGRAIQQEIEIIEQEPLERLVYAVRGEGCPSLRQEIVVAAAGVGTVMTSSAVLSVPRWQGLLMRSQVRSALRATSRLVAAEAQRIERGEPEVGPQASHGKLGIVLVLVGIGLGVSASQSGIPEAPYVASLIAVSGVVLFMTHGRRHRKRQAVIRGVAAFAGMASVVFLLMALSSVSSAQDNSVVASCMELLGMSRA